MKTIEQVKEEYETCPQGHSKDNLIFSGETVYCTKCKADYDLGMKKYK
ncbi:MAG: hypothetical protein AB7V77_06000 [Candidatus Woesearchaeota archaeon]